MGTEPQLGTVLHDTEEKFDMSQLGDIIKALDFLRSEAKKNGNEQVYNLINSTFNICYVSYQMAQQQLAMQGTRKFSS